MNQVNQAVPELLTIGAIAKKLPFPLHRIEYVINTRRIIPVGRAGNARVFTDADVQYILSELRRMDEEREGLS